jgi:hypothetical protein
MQAICIGISPQGNDFRLNIINEKALLLENAKEDRKTPEEESDAKEVDLLVC